MRIREESVAGWDLPTAMALAALSWMLLMVGHEVVGHGTACVGLGGEALAVDAMYFTCSELSSPGKDLLYRAAGSGFNVLVGVLSILILRRLKNPRSWLGYFLWISVLFNFLQSGAYVAFGRLIHPGMDWAKIVAAAPADSPRAVAVTIAGVALILAALLAGRLF